MGLGRWITRTRSFLEGIVLSFLGLCWDLDVQCFLSAYVVQVVGHEINKQKNGRHSATVVPGPSEQPARCVSNEVGLLPHAANIKHPHFHCDDDQSSPYLPR